MIELVPKGQIQKNENEDDWYGIFHFKDVPDGEVAQFIAEIVKALGIEADGIGSTKGVYDMNAKAWSSLHITIKGFPKADDAQYAMDTLEEVCKAHKKKGQKSLDEG